MDVNKEAVIIGAGLTGSVIARELADNGYQVTIIEKRNHIGGNMYDCFDDSTGILYHKYGPHTFHTKEKRLFDYFNRFIETETFYLRCTSIIKGKEVPCPFNFETIDTFYSEELGNILKEKLNKEYGKQATILELLNSQDQMIREYGNFLFEQDYKPYTMKQWGLAPEQVDPYILRRVPVYFDYNDHYFTDEYQCIPKTTYTDFFKNLLNHKNIKVVLGSDASKKITFKGDKALFDNKDVLLVYTGMIDRLFGYQYGMLPYRTLSFKKHTINKSSFQRGVVCATPSLNNKGTRRVEYSKMPTQKNNKTIVFYEYSHSFDRNKHKEAYYPVNKPDSETMYNQYVELSNKYRNLHICGRLGLFKYLNMDQALSRALDEVNTILGK